MGDTLEVVIVTLAAAASVGVLLRQYLPDRPRASSVPKPGGCASCDHDGRAGSAGS